MGLEIENNLYSLFHQVMRHHFTRSHRMLEKIGIYPGQPPLLFALAKNDGLSQKDLANRLNVKPATITVMIKRMEKAGHIKRVQDEADQRITRVYLCDSGRRLIKDIKATIEIMNKEFFKNLTVEEEAVLKKILIKILSNLHEDNNKEIKRCLIGGEEVDQVR